MTKEGYVVNVPSNQYLPSFPEPEFKPDSSNDDLSRLRPDLPTTPPQPSNPPSPQPTPQRPVVQPTYQPEPSIPTPSYESLPTEPPVNILPSKPPARINPVTPRQPPYQPQANQPRPSVVSQDQSSPVPAACPAAMNCTLIDYCTAGAVISKTPVELTEFQKEYRVPMTDCMIMPSRELGKCCRDPDYTDPWPVGRLGQYNADELNAVFDSGAYKPDRQNAVRKRASLRAQPNAVATNQVVTRVAAPVVQQRVAQPIRPNREIPVPSTNLQSSNASPNADEASCGVRNYVRICKTKQEFYNT